MNTSTQPDWSELLTSASMDWPHLIVPLVVGCYVGLCRSLRYRRLYHMMKTYPYGPTSSKANTDTDGRLSKLKPYSEMTDDDAYDIIARVTRYEFPTVTEAALEVALVRTYGIPSISKLLLRTQQLGTTKNVAKRYADTNAIMAEIYSNPPSSARTLETFGRLNFLHGQYIKAGKISNDDMLYVLSLFMNHPIDYIDRLEWRKITDLERCAYGVFHKSMGDAMEIDFSPLPSSKTGGWTDGLHFYAELDAWSKAYEEREMVPHSDNNAMAVPSIELYQRTMPAFMHRFVGRMVTATMDDRMRNALVLEKPPAWCYTLLNTVFAVKRFFCGYLLLPRRTAFSYFADDFHKGDVNPDGTRNMARYLTLPYYVKPTMWNRWGPPAWIQRLIGVPLPGDKGMLPEGFLLKDIGPDQFSGKGWEDAERDVERLRVTRTGACPFR